MLAFIPVLGWLCMLAILFSLGVLWLMGFLGALKGEQNPVPVLGQAYRRWFDSAFT